MISSHPTTQSQSVGFGRFIEDGSCYEVTNPPHRPWVNVLHNAYNSGDMFAQISQNGEGPIFYRTPSGEVVRLVDYESMGLYVRDDETGESVSPLRAPLMSDVDGFRYEVRAGQSNYFSQFMDIEFRARLFVPASERVLIWSIYLKNNSPSARRLSTFFLTKVAIDNPVSDVIPELGGVYTRMYDSKGIDQDHRCFLALQNDFFQASGHREDILEPPLNFSMPRLLKGHDLSGRSGLQFRSMSGVQGKSVIEPGETRRLDILLGHSSSPEAALDLKSRFTGDYIDHQLEMMEAVEKRRASTFSIETGREQLDPIINHFAKKQLTAYLASKSGFRDNVQVCYALDMADEKLAEEALITALSYQYINGWVPHHFRPLSKKECSDGPVWILLGIPWHIKQTGDFSFLDRIIPYLDSENHGTVWEHLLRAAEWLLHNKRPNGLSDLLYGDWNDGLSARGENGGRSSVMLSQQLCAGLLEFAELADRIGEEELAGQARKNHAEMSTLINELAWDGAWYQRVICDDGTILGSKSCQEGKIFMNTQSWAVLGGVAKEDRATVAMDSVEQHLKLDIGYRVVNPPYSKFDSKVGQSSTVFPGVTENGGCYNHAAGFKIVADCMLGRAELAWDTLLKVAPDNPENPLESSEMEPYAFSNMFYADPYNYGKTLYAWNTGTGAWFTMAVLEWILGVRRHYDGLLIDPCLSKRVPEARVSRKFRGAIYHVHLDNRAARCTGVRELKVDGEIVDSNVIKAFDGGEHVIEVII